jgi:hypothetical protein
LKFTFEGKVPKISAQIAKFGSLKFCFDFSTNFPEPKMTSDVFCRCCLQIGNKSKLMDMESGHFVHNNKRISFIEGYCGTLDVGSMELTKVPVVNMKICQLCIVHLESAYAFRHLCKQTNKILEQKYATFGTVKIKREELYEDFEEELNYIPEKIYKPNHRPTPMVMLPGFSSKTNYF